MPTIELLLQEDKNNAFRISPIGNFYLVDKIIAILLIFIILLDINVTLWFAANE